MTRPRRSAKAKAKEEEAERILKIIEDYKKTVKASILFMGTSAIPAGCFCKILNIADFLPDYELKP